MASKFMVNAAFKARLLSDFSGGGVVSVFEMDDSTCLPVLSGLRADTYTQGNSIGRVSHPVATRYAVYSTISPAHCFIWDRQQA